MIIREIRGRFWNAREDRTGEARNALLTRHERAVCDAVERPSMIEMMRIIREHYGAPRAPGRDPVGIMGLGVTTASGTNRTAPVVIKLEDLKSAGWCIRTGRRRLTMLEVATMFGRDYVPNI